MESSHPIKISEIKVKGNNRTKISYFSAHLDQLLTSSSPSASRHPLTYGNAHSQLIHAISSLDASGIFESVHGYLKVNQVANGQYKADIEIEVKEKNIPFLGIGASWESSTSSSGLQPGGNVHGGFRSPFGYGEIIGYKIDSKEDGASQNLNISVPYAFPSILPKNSILHVSLKSSDETPHLMYSSYKQSIHSLSVDVLSSTIATNWNRRCIPLRHALSVGIEQRDEIPITHDDRLKLLSRRDPVTSLPASSSSSSSPSSSKKEAALPPLKQTPKNNSLVTSNEILSILQPSSKLFARYSVTFDDRDNVATPSRGKYLSSTVELSVPPGDVQSMKAEVEAQYHKTLISRHNRGDELIFSLRGFMGLIAPILVGGKQPSVFLSDHYHMGGPLNLHGFNFSGIGPRSTPVPNGSTVGDSLGGLTKAGLSMALSVPIASPHSFQQKQKQDGGTSIAQISRASIFVNAGSLGLGGYNSSSPFFGHPRLSVGTAVSLDTRTMGVPGKLECSYSLPILRSPTDSVQSFQLCMAANFF